MYKVVRGNPTPEELAAALAVVQARAAAEPAAAGAGGRLERWADPAWVARSRMPQPGPGAWRTTYWPH